MKAWGSNKEYWSPIILYPYQYSKQIQRKKVSQLGMEDNQMDIKQDYDQAKSIILNYYNNIPINLRRIERHELEQLATQFSKRPVRFETTCVIYLRQMASDYESIVGTIFEPRSLFRNKYQRHVLDIERRTWIDLMKKRALTEIAEIYPWLKPECERQIHSLGLEDDFGSYTLPFGPYKGQQLRQLHSDYLTHLLGQGFVRHCFRKRIERELAERQIQNHRNISFLTQRK